MEVIPIDSPHAVGRVCLIWPCLHGSCAYARKRNMKMANSPKNGFGVSWRCSALILVLNSVRGPSCTQMTYARIIDFSGFYKRWDFKIKYRLFGEQAILSVFALTTRVSPLLRIKDMWHSNYRYLYFI